MVLPSDPGGVVEVIDSALIVSVQGVRRRLHPGESVDLPSGVRVLAACDVVPPTSSPPLFVDATFLHASMVSVSLVVCMVSALWFAPLEGLVSGGAGLPTEAHRWLSLPGGTARRQSTAVWSAQGRPPVVAERPLHAAATHNRSRPRRGAEPSVNALVAALKEGLPGTVTNDTHQDARDVVGDVVRALAAAPVMGAGVGGLSPRDLVDTGRGNGLIDVANAPWQRRKTIADPVELPPSLSTPPVPSAPTFPVRLVDVPPGAVDPESLAATPALDPEAREHLMAAVAARSNVLRGCYEAWGLASGRLRSGRVVVELTLRPNGYVTDIATTSTEELLRVAQCVTRGAADWYLGDGLVDRETRLSFPFILRPRA